MLKTSLHAVWALGNFQDEMCHRILYSVMSKKTDHHQGQKYHDKNHFGQQLQRNLIIVIRFA